MTLIPIEFIHSGRRRPSTGYVKPQTPAERKAKMRAKQARHVQQTREKRQRVRAAELLWLAAGNRASNALNRCDVCAVETSRERCSNCARRLSRVAKSVPTVNVTVSEREAGQ